MATEISVGMNQVQVMTQSGGRLFRYTFTRRGDDLFLDKREKAKDPGAGNIPNWRNASDSVSSNVRSKLNARGFSVSTSDPPNNGSASMGPF